MKSLLFVLVLLFTLGGCRLLLSATDLNIDVHGEVPALEAIDDPNSTN